MDWLSTIATVLASTIRLSIPLLFACLAGLYSERSGVFDIERGQSAVIRKDFWQTDTSVAKNSWGYTTNQEYKTVVDLVHDLIDIVSKNGALLLNIGPRRRHNTGAGGRSAAGDRTLATGEWRGDLRYSSLEGLRRRTDSGRGRQLQ